MKITINKQGYLEGRYNNLIMIFPPNYPIYKLEINLKFKYEQYNK